MDPKNCRFTQTHEWAFREGNKVTVGLTAHAIEQLGDIVFLELPKIGAAVKRGSPFGVIESVKAASDIYAPVSGKVVEVNEALPGALDQFKSDPYGKAWLIRVEASAAAEYDALMSAADYDKSVEAGH
jgi:glycine cleavage system H protein